MFFNRAPVTLDSGHKGKLPDECRYKGKAKLKCEGVTIRWSQDHMQEYIKCSMDPIYFILTYCKIRTLDGGIVPFKLYDRQKELLNLIHNNRKVVVRAARQVGKSEISAAYMLWYAIFNSDKLIAILANKEETAKEILKKAKRAFMELPFWLQQGIVTWNQKDIELENGSRILAAATASDAIRGYTINLLFLDEFAHVENQVAEDFFAAVYPTISSGTTSKIIVVSTPKGYNHFYRLWDAAEKKKNGFETFFFHWKEVPGRDQKWADDQRGTLGDHRYRSEVLCDFLGSSMTLISPDAIARMNPSEPILQYEGLDVYKEPIKGRAYCCVVDVSRGMHLDYSAFVIFDITELPYTIAAKYRRNDISTMLYPNVIADVARKYNEAYTLVEINDAGQQVADLLVTDLEYENLFYTSKSRSKANQPESLDPHNRVFFPGIRTTKPVKRIGCSAFKALVEFDKLIINDYDLKSEISTFVMEKELYQAEDGHNDDLVMCCVLFGWLSNQTFFKDLTNIDVRAKLMEEQKESLGLAVRIIVHNMTDTGKPEDPPAMEKIDGDLWFSGSIDDLMKTLGYPDKMQQRENTPRRPEDVVYPVNSSTYGKKN